MSSRIVSRSSLNLLLEIVSNVDRHEDSDFVPHNCSLKKLLISSMLFVSLMSTTNFSSLRLDNFIQLLDTSSVTIGLELMFLNLCLFYQRESALFVVPEES